MQQGGGGGQYGVPQELGGQFAAGAGMEQQVEGPSAAAAEGSGSLEEMMSAPEEALAVEEAERGPSGNRWPPEETLALLKIRSEMDAVFRDATLKGPLWEDVSRKLGELGYNRSAKKCKEKFENVHKYYKRTKDSRTGRQDGKSYRFYSQLEALHSGSAGVAGSSSVSAAALAATPISVGVANPVSARPQAPFQPVSPAAPPVMAGQVGASFSTSEEEAEEEGEESEEETEEGEEAGRKRREAGPSSSGKKMRIFFEGLMRQVMEQQEMTQQRFLEAIEKREQDRMIREEAWRRQEMARLTREQDLLSQERAMAASRDAAVISFLQRISGQTIHLPPAPPPPQPSPTPPNPTPIPAHAPTPIPAHAAPPPTDTFDTPPPPTTDIRTSGVGGEGTSSRWPKAEVLALIKLRSELEVKYQEAGPKGPLWEEISTGMHRLGYHRSSKRCKEKWENINKYFKKVKESNKKRPEDAKTCPYFHELDALYRKKTLDSGPAAAATVGIGGTSAAAHATPAGESKSVNGKEDDSGRSEGGSQVQTSNGGGTAPVFFGEEAASAKKPEDIVKELMGRHQSTITHDEYDDDGEDDDDDEEEGDGEIGGYEIQFQRQAATGSSNAAAPSDTFLTIVQ